MSRYFNLDNGSIINTQMTKRRTRKQKVEANNTSFTISWNPEALGVDNKHVKSQSQKTTQSGSNGNRNFKKANKSEKDLEFAHLKHELKKSLLFASLILGLLLVLYFAGRTNV